MTSAVETARAEPLARPPWISMVLSSIAAMLYPLPLIAGS
jgi:hypothetical protein